MNELEQLLQQRIEQLEAGEPLEVCLADLPEPEAKALNMVAAVRALAVDDVSETSVADQRSAVLGAAAARLNGGGAAAPETATASFLSQLQAFIDRLWTQRELAFGLAALLVILLFGLVWRGVTQGRNSDETQVAEAVTGVDNVEANEPVTAVQDSENSPAAAEQETSDTAVAAAPAVPEGPTVYLSVLGSTLNINAHTAILEGVQGSVEIKEKDGEWTAVGRTTTLAAGQRLRTADLSQATLTFYDGSQAYLGANTEISIDQLNAQRPEQGFRTVVMTQWLGETEHSVQFRNDGGSLYEVKTPSGSGIARGTKFQVLVLPADEARYIVTEGKVDVTGQNRTVSVTAGQVTNLVTGNVPAAPLFTISGEGEVTATGATWTVAGQSFQTHEHTIIVGNPQVGDLVHIDGHLLDDGNRVADRIVLLRRAVANRFSLSGEVEATGDIWTVAGQTIVVNGETVIDEDIVVGDEVQVEGLILAGGTLQATVITRLEEAPGLPFQFSGVVQSISDGGWTISDRPVALDGETAVDEGLEVGDVVTVRGWILESGSWLATEIQRQTDDAPAFEFTGTVQNMAPWLVGGLSFETRPWTVIAPNIDVGDRVQVRGTILSDGTWVATTVSLLADAPANTVTFVGVVGSMNPWVVNGLPLVITDQTVILGNITVGSMVIVQAQLLPDGSWTVVRIRPLYPDFGYGCLLFSSPVIAVNAENLRVKHWHVDIKRDGRIKIHGNIKVNSVITLPICTAYDGTIIILGDVIVIYQPVIIIINNGGGGGIPDGCRLNSKGSIKCSGRGSKGSKGSR